MTNYIRKSVCISIGLLAACAPSDAQLPQDIKAALQQSELFVGAQIEDVGLVRNDEGEIFATVLANRAGEELLQIVKVVRSGNVYSWVLIATSPLLQ